MRDDEQTGTRDVAEGTAGAGDARADAGDARAGAADARAAALSSFLAQYFAARPVNATFTGMHGHDHRLPDWSAAGVARTVAELRALRARIAGLGEPPVGACIAERDWVGLDLALADSCLEIQLAELEGRQFQRGNPSLVIGEAVFALVSLMIRDFAPVEQRARMLRSRLAQLPRFLASSLAVIAEAPVPPTWADKALKECVGGRLLLGAGLDRWRAAPEIPDDLRAALRREGDMALGALEGFAAELAALPRDPAPARACGGELLALLVRRGHWCERSLDDLLAEVRASFDAERTRLEEMARAVDPSGLPGVQERLAAAHPTGEAYYAAFQRTWDACHALATARDLVTWPHAPIRYVPFPDATRDAAPHLYYLYYRAPAPLEWPAVHDYVVAPIDGLAGEALERHLRAWNDSVIKLNHVVHHGALGHHVQNRHAAHAPLQLGRIAAVDCASRIGMFLGGTMAEGWACYATDLMDECGFLTPEERVSEQQTRVRMLARALVDLEFHTGQRTFDEAVALYAGAVGMPPAVAHGEAVKNSMFPGTALMYWLGTSQIHALRAREQARRGDRFSLKAFHDSLLSYGSIPVALAGRLLAGEAE
ncbi:MAG TPA: DUF885 family protein [Gemmatimonadaceae bacterium]|nr:DUF885 family protein [Gemmatimonadaceae bacterium]